LAELAARLVDSQILPVIDITEVEGGPAIIMPLIEGGNLHNVIQHRRAVKKDAQPPNPHAWALMDDRAYLATILPVLDRVIAAVAATHAGGVLHRDIKPANILIDKNGSIWLSDFGLADLIQSTGENPLGGGMGTRGYASPEQSSGAESNERSDEFSLGVTVYQVLTLQLPYGNRCTHLATSPPIPPSQLQPNLRKDFDAVLLKALQLNAPDRYPSVRQFQENWNRVRQSLLPEDPRPSRSRQIVHSIKHYPWRVASGALVACVIGLMALMLLTRPSSGGDPQDTTVRRTILLETEPPGARLVMVPVDPQNGVLLADKRIDADQKTPVRVDDVPVGEYLVVADVTGHGFHEVYRTVPAPESAKTHFGHQSWEELPSGTVRLPSISIPSLFVVDGMALFAGGEFMVGSEKLQGVPPHSRHVDAFYLDPTEVTAGEYHDRQHGYPVRLRANPPPRDHSVSWVTFDEAVNFAELKGKRLPDEFEYEFAATNGGATDFPWGDQLELAAPWRIGPIRNSRTDCLPTKPPVYGLFSDVAEWTTSGFTVYPGTPSGSAHDASSNQFRRLFTGARAVRGAPVWVVEGQPAPQDANRIKAQFGPRFRFFLARDSAKPGLGFRLARSAKPRFLD
jgi:formylglycine-generating enzyme required for sulfatase activity